MSFVLITIIPRYLNFSTFSNDKFPIERKITTKLLLEQCDWTLGTAVTTITIITAAKTARLILAFTSTNRVIDNHQTSDSGCKQDDRSY